MTPPRSTTSQRRTKRSLTIGDATIWHADCFTVFPTLPDGSVDLILADLPYGRTACGWDTPLDLPALWAAYTRLLKPKGAVILTATQPFTWQLCASNPAWFKYELIWQKPNGTNPLLVHKQPFRVHENILVFYQQQPTYNPQKTTGHGTSAAFADPSKTLGEAYSGPKKRGNRLISMHRANTDGTRFPRSVQNFDQERTGHPTKKPVALMAWLIRTYSHPGDLVLDNTMGEGTTGVACLQEGRGFLGMEQDAAYFNTATLALQQARPRQGVLHAIG